MVDGGNESLGVAVLNLTGTRTAARPATPPPLQRPRARRPRLHIVYTPTNNHAGDMTLHYITTTLILIGII